MHPLFILRTTPFFLFTFRSLQANTSSLPQIGTSQRAASLQNWVKFTKQQRLMAFLFFTPSDPYMETDLFFFFFFPPVSGNSWKAKATSWVGEETGEVLTCRQAGDPGKSHRQEEPDWLWPPGSRLGVRQLKDVSKPCSDYRGVLQEIAAKLQYAVKMWEIFYCSLLCFCSLWHKMRSGPELYLTCLFEGYCV